MTVLFDPDDSLTHEAIERGRDVAQLTSNINSSSVRGRYEICYNQRENKLLDMIFFVSIFSSYFSFIERYSHCQEFRV